MMMIVVVVGGWIMMYDVDELIMKRRELAVMAVVMVCGWVDKDVILAVVGKWVDEERNGVVIR